MSVTEFTASNIAMDIDGKEDDKKKPAADYTKIQAEIDEAVKGADKVMETKMDCTKVLLKSLPETSNLKIFCDHHEHSVLGMIMKGYAKLITEI